MSRLNLVPSDQAALAVTVHPGPHDDIDVTYRPLGAYVTDHALAIDGPVHETYLTGRATTLTRTRALPMPRR